MIKKIFILTLVLAFTITNLFSQIKPGNEVTGKGNIKDFPNTITTTVPFLLIAPDSRAGAMGDAGVATTPDANSLHWNPAKFAFIDKNVGVSISYSPWLRNLIKDMNLAYLSAYGRINKENVVSASLLYFDLGSMRFTDESGALIKEAKPHEFALDMAYSRLLTKKFSGSVALRFIYSNIASGVAAGAEESRAGKSLATDVSFYYYNDELELSGMNSILMAGVNISNIGSKISYTTAQHQDFIPANFRAGVGYLLKLDDHNEILGTVDFNKLLVPSPPEYYGSGEILPNGDTVKQAQSIIKYGKNPKVSVPAALFTSWYDAPGSAMAFRKKDGTPSTFNEELSEFTVSLGMEYWYDKQFALRLGYFHESESKGNRKYFTLGAGFRLNAFGIDISYLVPTTHNNPLQNTLRFSLLFDVGASN